MKSLNPERPTSTVQASVNHENCGPQFSCCAELGKNEAYEELKNCKLRKYLVRSDNL